MIYHDRDFNEPLQHPGWQKTRTLKNLPIYSLQFHWICGYNRHLLHWQWEHSTWRMQHQLDNFQTWSFDLSMFYADPKSRWALLQWPGIFWRFHSDRIHATAWHTTTFWSVMSYFWSSIHFRSLNIFQRLIIQKRLSYTHLFQKIINNNNNNNKINTDKYKTFGN
jgi:hypothetical protein